MMWLIRELERWWINWEKLKHKERKKKASYYSKKKKKKKEEKTLTIT